ncbi:MAG: hypothetical protein ACYDAK_05000 [Candidatus Limnocylindrales bacterium]
MDNVYLVAAAWMGLALAASLVSIRPGISVALVEIAMGVLAGNTVHLRSTPWTDFLVGAEIDPESVGRRRAIHIDDSAGGSREVEPA